MDESSNYLATQYVTDYVIISWCYKHCRVHHMYRLMDWLNLMRKISTDIHVGYTTKKVLTNRFARQASIFIMLNYIR